jgi:hypothetical protein
MRSVCKDLLYEGLQHSIPQKSMVIMMSIKSLKSFEQEQRGKLEFAMLLNSRSLVNRPMQKPVSTHRDGYFGLKITFFNLPPVFDGLS